MFYLLDLTIADTNVQKVACGRVETESGGRRRRTGEEVKGKKANGVGSQQSSA